MSGRSIISTLRGMDVRNETADGGKFQQGVILAVAGVGSQGDDNSIQGSYVAQGNGGVLDASATALAYLGPSGAYFDDEDDIPIPRLGTLLTWAIGFTYAPRGEERVLMFPTAGPTGFGFMYEHGFEDAPVTQNPGEVWMLHRSAPKSGGEYATATFNAGIRYLNDGPTPGDDLGTTEIGYKGAQTVIQTAGGWKIVEDDTNEKLSIYFPTGVLAMVVDANAAKIEFAGSTGAAGDALMRQANVAAAISAYHTWLTGTFLPANFSTASKGTGWSVTTPGTLPTPSGSLKTFSE